MKWVKTRPLSCSKVRLFIACKTKLLQFSGFQISSPEILWGNCKFSLLMYLYIMFQLLCKIWIILLPASVLVYFSKFRSLVFDLLCFFWTEIYTNTVFLLICAGPQISAALLGIHVELSASPLISVTPLMRRLLEQLLYSTLN